MKKAIIFCLFVACTYGTANAQAYQNVIKTSPIGLAFGNFNVTYERPINEKSSIIGKANYFYQFLGVDVNTFGLGGAYRYYFTHAKKDVPTGFYVNPQVGFQFGSSDDVNYGVLSFGAELGYQWAWDSGFVLDLGIGPNFSSLSGDYEDIAFDESDNTIVLPSVTIAIGYAF